MAYTSHGHYIPFTTKGAEPAPERCGGVESCKRCLADVAYLRRNDDSLDSEFLRKAEKMVREYIDTNCASIVEPLPYTLEVVWNEWQNDKWYVFLKTNAVEGMNFEVIYDVCEKETTLHIYLRFAVLTNIVPD